MVGDIGQPTHLHYDMFYFYTSGHFLLVYARYYTIVAYALCVVIPLYQYAYGTIL